MRELVRIEAQQSKMYTLPDSTKVWMQPGSSIQYTKDFNKDRKVWLSGNSLFEVCKHEESTFQVHIDKAFIEVKGTCFLIKQDDAKKNEITLFNGKIEFNIESTGERIVMHPLQKVTYNVENAQTQIENISNISWENGRYHFEDVPLTQLIETVNQMYKTNIVLKRNLKKKALFSGSIRYDETLDDVLDKICFSLNLTIETHNEQIIIH
ncbi:FecR family protein [Bacteroides congonensis]